MSSGKANINYSVGFPEGAKVVDITPQPVFEKLDINSLKTINLDKKLTKFYGRIINIHFFLCNNKELTNDQKLDYCTIERNFMKLYLREMIKKV